MKVSSDAEQQSFCSYLHSIVDKVGGVALSISDLC